MIKVEDLYFKYPLGAESVRGVSLEIDDQEFLAIMGENGAGKTTLVKHFNGILKPTTGNVFVNELNTKKVSVAELSRDVGLVFQNPDHQLFCETVEDEITFGLKNFGFNEKTIVDRVEWSLNLLGLTKYRKSSPFMLSGGERKRVALAAVLAWNPEVIVLDEPTIGQDYGQKEKLRQFISQINSEGKTVVVVTHDVEFVVECNPRVVLMSKGRILADGPARKILTDCELLAKASIIPPQIVRLFHYLKDYDLPENIMDTHEAIGILEDFIKKGKSLENH